MFSEDKEDEKKLLPMLEVGLAGLLARGMNRGAPLTGSTIVMAREVLGLGVDSVGEVWPLFWCCLLLRSFWARMDASLNSET